MLWTQFILANLHFAIQMLAALAFFAVFWLYFDAWVERKNGREIPRLLGWMLLALSFAVSAGVMETQMVVNPILAEEFSRGLVTGLRLLGYGLLVAGIGLEPLQDKPKLAGISKSDFAAGVLGLGGLNAMFSQSKFLLPILVGLAALLYWRRGTLGLEFHVRPLAKALFVVSLMELLALAVEFRQTARIAVYEVIAPFGWVWLAEQLILLAATLVVFGWVWHYLLKRLEIQLFMIYVATVLTTFLTITVAFTGLLVKNIQDETLARLETDVQVLKFALESKLAVVSADAETLAADQHIQTAVTKEDLKTLRVDVEQYLLNKTETMMVVTDGNGRVLARGEDREKIGDSLSDNPMVAKALAGEKVASVVIGAGVLAPRVWVRAAAPIRAEQEIVGAVLTGVVLDNAFVDGVKQATGLEASLYADNVLSATTLYGADGVSRYLGTAESNERVAKAILAKENYVGGVQLFNSDYFGAYKPLTNSEGAVVGMLFVGTPQERVFRTAGRSMELTFLIAIGLVVAAVWPSKLISNYIVKQLK